MLNLDDTAKPAGKPSVQPLRDGRKASGDERQGELTGGAPSGTKRAALAPYFWLALVVVVNSGDKTAIEAAYGDLGKNGCGNCHTTFREKIEK